ncbi:efflux RND transporter periplasmic adaptor subunit [Zeimonas arvi]|uniref:Efflux RND transporter periplasmic adaptor subunit n=1 Tax=Zeimonas arvi TaxID=2498847 RepID=A0A5C8P172_9BURK|nr:efflux RND transporter periplasmic adaptor subunit [Zeimonas arvi]TXL66997.1 efflux RND transporter periplasmic adaptor subunit [Zeimonas arvi]
MSDKLTRLALAGALALTLLAGCGDRRAEGAQGPGASPPPPLPVTTLTVAPKRIQVTLEAVGRAEGSREVEVRARVSGILERQLFREGDAVRAGAPMYRIERAPFEIALQRAKAALAETQARRERAAVEAARLKKLLGERAVSQREYDDAAASLAQLDAALQAARAGVREAELDLSYTSVEAPASGVAGRSLRSEGSLVGTSRDDGLLTTIVRHDPLWVRFSLSESEYARLRAGRGEKSRVAVRETPGQGGSASQLTGKLNFTGSRVDPQLGTVQLRAEFANPDSRLLPGQYLGLAVEIGETDAILVPQSAVQQGDRGSFVWVVGDDDTVAPRPVKTGEWVGRDWVVREGLKAGERVAVDNLIRLRPGAKVAPKPPAPAS